MGSNPLSASTLLEQENRKQDIQCMQQCQKSAAACYQRSCTTYSLRQHRKANKRYWDLYCLGEVGDEEKPVSNCKPANDRPKRRKPCQPVAGPQLIQTADTPANDFNSDSLARPRKSSAKVAVGEPYEAQGSLYGTSGDYSSTIAAATTAAVLEVPAAPPASSPLAWAADGQHSSSASAASAFQQPPARAVSQHVSARTAARSQAAQKLVCTNCQYGSAIHSKAETWRAGPAGPKTLCNACGLKWSKHPERAAKYIKPGSIAAKALVAQHASQLAADPAAVAHHGSDVQMAALAEQPMSHANSSVSNVAANQSSGDSSRSSRRLAANSAAYTARQSSTCAAEQVMDDVSPDTLDKAEQLPERLKRKRPSEGDSEESLLPASSKRACTESALQQAGYNDGSCTADAVDGNFTMTTGALELQCAEAADLLAMVAPGGCTHKLRRSRRINDKRQKKQSTVLAAAPPQTTAMPAVDEVAHAAAEILVWMAKGF